MINLGNIEIADLRLGASQVKALYFGSEQAWSGEEPGPDWLCFTAAQANSTVRLDKVGSPDAISLETSTDGSTWTDYGWTDLSGDTIELTSVGDKVYMRAKTENTTIGNSASNRYMFTTTGSLKASGNIQSMLKADCSRTDAPAYCYQSLFYGCTALVTAPELPATRLSSQCYTSMFAGCTALTAAPELPATELALGCYSLMFLGCTSLQTAPALPATLLGAACYQYMFNNCTSLTSAPDLSATALLQNCYANMFAGCTSLTEAPAVLATSLAQGCYANMFAGCSALTAAPELPATTLASLCYKNMFDGCTSLTDAPELPAATLTSYCYYNMFVGCQQLSSVLLSSTAWSPTNATTNWLSGVAASGTFTCPAELPDTRGASNIPDGWTKVDAA